MPIVSTAIVLTLLIVIACLTLSGTFLGVVVGVLGTLLGLVVLLPIGYLLYMSALLTGGRSRKRR